jgi:hypothetical protein
LKELQQYPVVALRCALRSFSALAGLADNPVHPQGDESERLFVAAMRGLVVSWATALYPIPPAAAAQASTQLLEAAAAFDAKLLTHYEQWSGLNDAHIGSMFDNLVHARRVVGFIGLALGAPISVTTAASIFPEDGFNTSPLPVGDRNWRRWHEQNRRAAEGDVLRLRFGTAASALIQERLWPDPEHEALAVTVANLRWHRFGRHHWLPQHVEGWVRERVPGALVLGLPAAASEERFRRIVELPNAFWIGRPAEDVVDGLDYALQGDLANPHWGEIKPSWQRLSREAFEAKKQADLAELAKYRRERS